MGFRGGQADPEHVFVQIRPWIAPASAPEQIIAAYGQVAMFRLVRLLSSAAVSVSDARVEFEKASGYAREGKLAKARQAFERIVGCGDPNWAERARIELGSVLKREGKVTEAAATFEQTIRSGHPDWAPCAANSLGLLLLDRNQTKAATDAFNLAVRSGHHDWAPTAAVNLGVLLLGTGDVAGARDAYQRAIDSDHPNVSNQAHYNLGVLLKDAGDLAGAREEYQRAIDSGHRDWAPNAALNLGVLLMGAGDLDGARRAYQRAINSGHPKWAPLAKNNLRLLDTPGFDPARPAVTSRHNATWVLRDGESLLLDAGIVTPTSNKQAVRVTITDQRIRLGDVALDYADIAKVSYRTWRPETDLNTIKIKHAGRREFVLTSRNGVNARLEFGDNYENNVEVWSQLVATAKKAVEPRLRQEAAATAAQNLAAMRETLDGIVSRLRAGEPYVVEGAFTDGTSLALTRDGCVVGRPEGSDLLAWCAEPRVAVHGGFLKSNGSLEISAIDARGKRHTYARLPELKQFHMVLQLMDRCREEFGAGTVAPSKPA